jgi:hypothetical protein
MALRVSAAVPLPRGSSVRNCACVPRWASQPDSRNSISEIPGTVQFRHVARPNREPPSRLHHVRPHDRRPRLQHEFRPHRQRLLRIVVQQREVRVCPPRRTRWASSSPSAPPAVAVVGTVAVTVQTWLFTQIDTVRLPALSHSRDQSSFGARNTGPVVAAVTCGALPTMNGAPPGPIRPISASRGPAAAASCSGRSDALPVQWLDLHVTGAGQEY